MTSMVPSRTTSSVAADGPIWRTCCALLCAFVKHVVDRSNSFDDVQPAQHRCHGHRTMTGTHANSNEHADPGRPVMIARAAYKVAM